MKTTTISSSVIFRISLALIAIVSCLFVFTACGGTPIEQDEAFTALSSATDTTQYADVNDYTFNMVMRVNYDTEKGKLAANINAKTIVNEGVAQIAINGDANLSGNAFGVSTNTSTKINSTFKAVNFDGVCYAFNESGKIKETITSTDYNDYIDFNSSIFGMLEVVLSEQLEEREGYTVVTDLKKVGENGYNLNFEFTSTSTQNEVTSTQKERYYYEIKDGKIAKFIMESSITVGESITSTYIEGSVQYGSSAISVPELSVINEYETESVIPDISSIIPT